MTEVPCWNRIGVHGDGSCPELAKVLHCRNCPVFSAGGQRLYDREPPPGYTDEWTERIAVGYEQTARETYAVVLFRAAGEWLALDVAYVAEVAPYQPVRRVPHQTDRVLAGLVNIRGELQLAVSLPHLLGAEDAPGDPARRRLLVAEKGGVRWAFVADEVHDIERVATAEVGPLPATVAAGRAVLTRGVFRWDGKSVGYLDPERLFAALARSFR